MAGPLERRADPSGHADRIAEQLLPGEVDDLVPLLAQQAVPLKFGDSPFAAVVLEQPVGFGNHVVSAPEEINPCDHGAIAARDVHLKLRSRQPLLTENDPRTRLQRRFGQAGRELNDVPGSLESRPARAATNGSPQLGLGRMPLVQCRVRHHDRLHEGGHACDIDDGPRRRSRGYPVQPGHMLIRHLCGVTDDPGPGVIADAGSRRNGERHGAGRRRVQQVQPEQLGRGVVAGHSVAGPGVSDRDDIQCVP